MSLVTKNYGLIITKGLGAPACCTLLTANFGLVCGCSVEIITPPVGGGGGGGGYIPVRPGYYIPVDRTWTKDTRIVVVTVKMGENTWRKHYVVDEPKAQYLVTVANIINNVAGKVRISIEKIKHISKKIIATFIDK